MSPEKRITMDNWVMAGCAFTAVIFTAGFFLGFRKGNFAAGLEGNKIAALRLRENASPPVEGWTVPLSPEFREFLKGRIYYNIATKFPNEAGYLLRGDWDFGPVDETFLKRAIYAKDPTCPAHSFDAATEGLSAAEKPKAGAPALDRLAAQHRAATSAP